MNRAWIPAGALAGVSVAGLLALGPLTDSMSTPVSFPTTVHTQTIVPKDFLPVSVTVNRGAVGQTNTRGGPAATTNSNSSEGFVAFHRKPAAKRLSTVPATSSTHSNTAKPKAPPVKKAPVRQKSIGGASETNSSAGLAGVPGAGRAAPASSSRRPGAAGTDRVRSASGPRTAGSIRARGAIAQLGERLDRTQEVSGSSPLSSISIQAVSSLSGATEKASGAAFGAAFPERGNASGRCAMGFVVRMGVPHRRAHVGMPEHRLHESTDSPTATESVAVACRRSWRRCAMRGAALVDAPRRS